MFRLDDYPMMVRRLISATQRPRFGDPRVIGLELSIVLMCAHVEGCYGEIFEGNTIAYSPKGGERASGLRVYHGLSHWVLERWYGCDYSEADAWLLTIELACCGAYLLDVGVEQLVADQRYAPIWLFRLYLEELQAVAVATANLPPIRRFY